MNLCDVCVQKGRLWLSRWCGLSNDGGLNPSLLLVYRCVLGQDTSSMAANPIGVSVCRKYKAVLGALGAMKCMY